MNLEVELERKLKELGHHNVSLSPLRSTNNTVFLVDPLDVVAKLKRGKNKKAGLELGVAHGLHELGAPVGAPAADFSRHHQIGDFELTFWKYYASKDPELISSEALSEALYQLHQCCAKLELKEQLPTCFERFNEVELLLEDQSALPYLENFDQRFLSELLQNLLSEAKEMASNIHFQLIHGEPHLHNILNVQATPKFVDWESACLGPVEWDLAYMTQDVVEAYPARISDQLISICRGLVSIAVATWCWRDVEVGDLRDHAEYHLNSLRTKYDN
ncbi:MAG: aminoglycoside phosphotransferase family protein [Pseudomonadales bacterium]|nr:aminoglycoside phosphotransferase family protein [Pseudomonadales bacterium]